MPDDTKPSTPGSMNPPPSPTGLPRPPVPSGPTPPRSGVLGMSGPAFSIPSSPGGVPTAPKPSGPSPLTPDIKIPPNLPTGEVKPPVVSMPLPPKPPTTLGSPKVVGGKPPVIGGPQVVGVRSPVTPTPTPAQSIPTKPMPPAPAGPTAPPIFKSSIRTMQDDLAALKKGEAPAGFKIEKESEKETKITSDTTVPKVTPPPPLISHIELGKLEKSRPITQETRKLLEAQKIPTPSQVSIPKPSMPSISIPSVGGLTAKFGGLISKRIFLVVVSLVIAGGITIGFVALRGPGTPQATATPTFTPRTPTATPTSLEAMLPVSDPVKFSLSQDMAGKYGIYVMINRLLPAGEPQVYRITDLSGKRYGFSEYTTGLKIEAPSGLKALVEDQSLYITAFNKSDNKTSFGFIVKLKNPNQVNETISVLKNWESTMTQSFSSPFLFDQTKATSTGFLDNTYNGVAIRYRNFPDVNSTIDYTVFKAKNGESYLIMVNSREHIYKIIDRLR